MGTIMNGVDSITGYGRQLRRAQRLLGAGEPAAPAPAAPAAGAMAPAPTDFNTFLRELRQSAPAEAKDSAPFVIGALAGAMFDKKHRVLGAIGGASIGRNVPDLFDARLRRDALCNMGQTGAGIAGALLFPRASLLARAAIFGAAWLGAGTVIHFTKLRTGA